MILPTKKRNLAVSITSRDENGECCRIIFNDYKVFERKNVEEGDVLSRILSGEAGLEFVFNQDQIGAKLKEGCDKRIILDSVQLTNKEEVLSLFFHHYLVIDAEVFHVSSTLY